MASSKHHAVTRYTGTNAERAALSTSGLQLGAAFFEIDTDDSFIWNGMSWVQADVVSQFGDADGGNYSQFGAGGTLIQIGTARIDWTKITADSVTLVVGVTPASLVADLQTRFDGNYYHIDEVAAAPGMDLIVDFVSVTAFNWVNVAAYYAGSTAHAGITIQVWNWDSSAWDNFYFYAHHSSVGALADDIMNGDFFIPDDTNYIGTGGNDGEVRVRLVHVAMGNAAHDHDIDVVALYQ